MNQSAKKNNILDSFFKSKYKVKKLYEVYCRHFPKQRRLWKALIKKNPAS